jgi:hypothetical protein
VASKILSPAQRNAARANIKKANAARKAFGTGGAPSSYRTQHDLMAYRLSLLGQTKEEIAKTLGISIPTLVKWCKKHPTFEEAILLGRDTADAAVADSLYRRATGYEFNTVKIVVDPKTGMTTMVPYTEHVPPDPASMIFWLKNRQRDRWRDRVEQKVDAKIEATVTQTDYSSLRKLLATPGNAG